MIFEGHSAGLDFGEVEDVVEDAEERSTGGGDAFEDFLVFAGQ